MNLKSCDFLLAEAISFSEAICDVVALQLTAVALPLLIRLYWVICNSSIYLFLCVISALDFLQPAFASRGYCLGL